MYWFHKLYHRKCAEKKLLQQNGELCTNLTYLDGVCQALPIQIAKVTRARLKMLSPILEDKAMKESVKVLLLVRDPRATINSRKKFPWCITSPDCIEAKNLCNDMVSDYYEAKRLINEHSTKIK